MQKIIIVILLFSSLAFSQNSLTIDGNFDDWQSVTTVIKDSANDEHDTDWWGDGLAQPVPRKYSDIDILEVKFTHDRENLYGYVKAIGVVGRTSNTADGNRDGRYYYIITIDVDNNDSTGYAIEEGNYWPNSIGYDMNMEVEFYNGSFNTGHYINHEFPDYDNEEANEAVLEPGMVDLENHIIRLAPGSYGNYLQYVIFPDTSFVYVSDRGPVIEGGIIEIAVSHDGHEAEMKAPMWGFFWDEYGVPIIQLGDTIDISFSLEGSGELSESAIEGGHTGNKSVWGSDTATPIVAYYLKDFWTTVEQKQVAVSNSFTLNQNYPNPFNNHTTIFYFLSHNIYVSLLIFNANGQMVSRLIDENQNSGSHQVIWNGSDENGNILSSGIYFAVLKAGEEQQVKRMVLLK